MDGETPEVQKPRGKCPICSAVPDVKYRPFCSKRCADIDLARWLSGTYVIEGGQADADEDGDDALAGRVTPTAAQDKIDENE